VRGIMILRQLKEVVNLKFISLMEMNMFNNNA
jgi:hypothetical protein